MFITCKCCIFFITKSYLAYVLSDHSNICLNNLEIGDKHIRFEEYMFKTFHGSLLDLKYEPRVVKHVCHEE